MRASTLPYVMATLALSSSGVGPVVTIPEVKS